MKPVTAKRQKCATLSKCSNPQSVKISVSESGVNNTLKRKAVHKIIMTMLVFIFLLAFCMRFCVDSHVTSSIKLLRSKWFCLESYAELKYRKLEFKNQKNFIAYNSRLPVCTDCPVIVRHTDFGDENKDPQGLLK